MRRSHRLFAALLAALLFGVACGPPPFVVHVTFPGEIDVQEGAHVVYEGIVVGQVERIALRQEDPRRAALVELTLEIDDPAIQLRTADRFHLASRRGVTVVEIEPAVRSSPPLADGASVPGVPPVISRIEGEIERAIEGIGKATLDAIEEALGGTVERLEEDEPAPEEAPSPRDASQPARPGAASPAPSPL